MKKISCMLALLVAVVMLISATAVNTNAYTPMLDLFQTTTGAPFADDNWVAYGYNPYSSLYGEQFAAFDHMFRASVTDFGGVAGFNYIQNVEHLQNSVNPRQVLSATHTAAIDGFFVQLDDQGSPTLDESYLHYSEMLSIAFSEDHLSNALSDTSFTVADGFGVGGGKGMVRDGIVITYRNTRNDYIVKGPDPYLPVYDTLTAYVISNGEVVSSQSCPTVGGTVGLVAENSIRIYVGMGGGTLTLHMEDTYSDPAQYINQTYIFNELDTSTVDPNGEYYFSVGRGTDSASVQETSGLGTNAAVHVHVDKIGRFVYDIEKNDYIEDCPVPPADWPLQSPDVEICEHLWGMWYYADEADRPSPHEIGLRTRECELCGILQTRPVTVIASADDLMWFAQEVNEVGDFTLDGEVTVNKIDMTGYDWTPIGTTQYSYSGVFDGNGCEIKGLDGMLFGNTAGARINEVGVNSGTFYEAPHASGAYTGAIVGNMQGGKLFRCYSRADYTGDSGSVVGGLVGRCHGVIENCYYAGKLDTGANAFIGFFNSNAYSKSAVINCYYDVNNCNAEYLYTGDTEAVADDIAGKTTREFRAGIVTALLNHPYGQVVGVDKYPNFTSAFKVTPLGERSIADVLEAPVTGDIVYSGEYKYTYFEDNSYLTYNNKAGWNAVARVITRSSYHRIPTELINIEGSGNITILGNTFLKAANMTVAPDIPATVTVLHGTYKYSGLTVSPVLPEGITDMYNTFYECTALSAAPVIPDGVKTMVYAFAHTPISEMPNIPDSVTDLSRCFAYCANITDEVTLRPGVDYFQTFRNTGITAVNVPADITYIPRGTFNDCASLTAVNYGGSVEDWIKLEIDVYNTPFKKAARSYAVDTDMNIIVHKGTMYICNPDEGIKDVFISHGNVTTYSEAKANVAVRITPTKLAGKDYYGYEYLSTGEYTAYTRYEDGSVTIVYFTVEK